MGFAENALALSVNPHESRRFLAPSSRLGLPLNRELNFNYQGIVIVYLGKLRPISELWSHKADVLARLRKFTSITTLSKAYSAR
jgi:hypothetical protein